MIWCPTIQLLKYENLWFGVKENVLQDNTQSKISHKEEGMHLVI